MKNIALLAATFLSVLSLSACDANIPLGTTEARITVLDMMPEEITDVDLLFVIDESSSMQEEQESLARWAENYLFGALQLENSDRLSLHIAVVTTSMGTGGYGIDSCKSREGIFTIDPGEVDCMPPDGRFIIDLNDGDGNRIDNFEGTLGEVFSCIAKVGTQGCGYEQPLAAMKKALDGSNPQNANFLREEALLAVIIVSDEDDCSVYDTQLYDPGNKALGEQTSFRCFEQGVICDQADLRAPGTKTNCHSNESSDYIVPVADYADFLHGLKDDPGKVIVSGIVGPVTDGGVEVGKHASGQSINGPALLDSCVVNEGIHGTPAVRLNEFLSLFPDRNQVASICSESLTGPLSQVAARINNTAGRSPCLHGKMAMTDSRPDCRVFRSAQGKEEEISQCQDTEDSDCYQLLKDAETCSDTKTQLALSVQPSSSKNTESHLIVRCTPEELTVEL